MRKVVLLVLALSCTDSTAPPVKAVPTQMLVVQGQDQLETVATELPSPLIVLVKDKDDQPVEGQIVNFRVISGGGSVFAGAGITNAAGKVQDRWTLGALSKDSQRVEARAVDPESGDPIVFAVFRATPRADVPSVTTKARGDSSYNADAGTPVDSLRLTVRDKHGNFVPNVSVTWSVTSGGGQVSPPISLTDSSGVARTRWTLGTQASTTQQAQAQVFGMVTPVVFNATAQAGPASALVVIRAGAGATADVSLSTQPLVRAVDAFGNDAILTGAVSVTVDSGAYVLGPAQATASGGTATFDIGLGGVGPHLLTFTSAGLHVSQPITITGPSTVYTQATVGWSRACALTSTGSVRCWAGSVGTTLAGAVQFKYITAGFSRFCGLSTANEPYCWSDPAVAPVKLADIVLDTLDAGTEWMCGLRSGNAQCWIISHALAPIVALDSTVGPFISLSVGGYHACGRTLVGVQCWGNNQFNQSTPPAGVFTQVNAGHVVTCGIKNGSNVCWGDNTTGQFNTGSFDTLGDFGTGRTVCALLARTPWCWGLNDSLQAGGVGIVSLPARAADRFLLTQVEASATRTCGVTPAGNVVCWGAGGLVKLQ
jgi:hypothetical protein